MQTLMKEQERLASNANLSKSVEDVQKTIDLLVKARESIAASEYKLIVWFPTEPTGQELICVRSDSTSTSVTLAKLQNPVKQSFEVVNDDLKELYKGHGRYQKVLNTV